MVWSTAFREAFHLVPVGTRTDRTVDIFLAGDGKSRSQILGEMSETFDRARTQSEKPDSRRYRAGLQLLRTIGLTYDEASAGKEKHLHVTDLGHAARRWREGLTPENSAILSAYAVDALAVCQLRNPTREGRRYGAGVEVFPFAFIWRALLALDGKITSEELNRAILATKNDDDLMRAIERIKSYRQTGHVESLGVEVEKTGSKNDRILVWPCWASFGFTIMSDKKHSPDRRSYTLHPWAERLVRRAVARRIEHRSFASEQDYVEHISAAAHLPPDLRRTMGEV